MMATCAIIFVLACGRCELGVRILLPTRSAGYPVLLQGSRAHRLPLKELVCTAGTTEHVLERTAGTTEHMH